MIEEGVVYRELVLNQHAADNSVSIVKLNPPYDMMVDLSKNALWSRNDDLMQTHLDTLHQLLLNSQLMSKNLLRASECVGNNPEATSMNRFLL